MDSTETEPSYHLYPSKRERLEPKDEIMMRNIKKEDDLHFAKTLTKSLAGAFVNQTSVPAYDLPGNFGARVIETMPTNMRAIHVDQHANLQLGQRCDDRPDYVPDSLPVPDHNDYLTDEESDEANEFEVKVPSLTELIDQFENDDDVILKERADLKDFVRDETSRGFQPEVRYDIKDDKASKIKVLNENIAKQREQQATIMPGFTADLNEAIIGKANKIFIK